MPYYVYAIHKDNTSNRLYGAYDNLKDAEMKEQEMRSGNYPEDNYFVRLIHAANEAEAAKKADEIRAFPKM